MVNIALCIPGNERKENPENYLKAVESVMDLFKPEKTDQPVNLTVVPSLERVIKIYHGMSLDNWDDFSKGLFELFKGIDVARIVIPSRSDRTAFAQELSDNNCEVFHIGPVTNGIQKELDALLRLGYVEQLQPKIVGQEWLSITRYTPGVQQA